MSSSMMGWECSRCTYRHHAPGTRCVMCNELRVNKEKMRDFILGKEIPKADKTNSSLVGCPGAAASVVAATSPVAKAATGSMKRTLSQQKMSAAFASSSPASMNATTTLRRSATDPSPSSATAKRRLTPNKSLSQQFIDNSFRSASPGTSSAVTTAAKPQTAQPTTVLAFSNPYARGARPVAKSQPKNAVQEQQRPPTAPRPHAVSAAADNDSVAAGTSSAMLRPALATRPVPATNNIAPQQACSTTSAVAQQVMNLKPAPPVSNSSRQPQAMPPPAASYGNGSSRHKDAPPSNNTESTSIHRRMEAPTGRPQNVHRMASTNMASKNPFSMAAAAAESKKRAPVVPYRRVYEPGPVPLDLSSAKTWIYPAADAYPKRQYQYDIAETAIMHNTLVSLPTGLGKTLIAAVVMYNYYRWFPTGKVIFMAPTLPLVRQQVAACYGIMGIPATDTALLTGKIQANQRTAIWSQKRVFFCTPQTVQKDLENGRFDPSQVVCCVLDEAHKASGEYAYCKVVAQLEESGAKFRVLGLSATPGTNLKAIQKVVDALRISCIEARSDADPDVSQYVHHRETEVVVVPQVTASKLVERAIDEIIHPVLDRLRSCGATPQRFPGNATVTAWCVQRAKQEYQKRPDHQGSLLGYFTVGHYFVQLRADLHRHGIGVVRNKLVQLRGSSQRGYMSTVTKGNQFQRLWDQVSDSSWDPNTEGGTAQDRLKNNPKLAKLLEILTEHFERARACETSSRAIVFSQFRDSVQEIESILQTSQPVIRGRHFVGQGKGSKAESGQKLKGMNQAEQQEAIRQFKDGTYNVLVCTCIGEEGLDIGEVDLIVNFDCLRSPIRMIQRVGRTGRKRDGRVVCLAAAGSEERTLKQSRVDERKLHHALKNPRSFKVIPTAPMFPEDPVASERNMTISQNFHMSQVDGVAKTKKRNSICGPEAKQTGRGRWRLNGFEEQKRDQVLGKLKDLRIEEPVESSSFPKELCRRVLFARTISVSRLNEKKRPPSLLGRTSELLRKFEESHSRTTLSTSSSKIGRARTARNGESALDVLFPLTLSGPTAKEDMVISPELLALDLSATTGFHQPHGSNETANLPTTFGGRVPNLNLDAENGLCNTRNHDKEAVAQNASSAHFTTATRDSVCEQDRGLPMLATLPVRVNPYAFRLTENNVESGASEAVSSQQVPPSVHRSENEHRKGAQFSAAVDTGTCNGSSLAGSKALTSSAQPPPVNGPLKSSQHEKEPNPVLPKIQVSKEPQNGPQVDSNMKVVDRPGMDEFAVPSQKNVDISNTEKQDSAAPFAEDVFCLPSQSSDDEDDIDNSGTGKIDPAISEMNAQEEDSFRLPTPESSSSEEESDREEAASLTKAVLPENIIEKAPVAPDTSQGGTASLLSQKSCGRVRFSLDNSSSAGRTGGHSNAEDTPESALPRRKKAAKRSKILAIEDTPESKAARTPSASSLSVDKSSPVVDLDHGLSNTQDDGKAPNICCAVCFTKRLSEEDPIILCDGPGDGASCPLAVHVSCYSAVVNLHDDSASWRCDLCEFRRNGGQTNSSRCIVCQRSDGVLKRTPAGEWKHVRCLKRIRRQNCDGSPAARGDLLDEARLPLADLSPNDESQFDFENRKKRRKRFFQQFIDDEAEAEDGMEDEDDDDIMAIEDEEEELANSFINDSSQLGFTQDELDRADPHDALDDAAHRSLDNERERVHQFKTPLLNRRMQEKNENSEWSPTPGSAPDSQKGLGNMHFIRSVLEHHRQGGNAEEIEQMYKQLENESDLGEENNE